MRVSNLLRALVITCAVLVALVGAQSADAALSWTGGADRSGGTDRSAAHECGGPCYVVNVEVHGIGRVTSVIPGPVAGATNPADQYPNGHVECPAAGAWNCSFYFNWPFDFDGLNPNNEVVVFQASGGTFLGWSSCPPGHATGNQCRLDGKEGEAGLVPCVVAEFQESPSTVTGNCDAEPATRSAAAQRPRGQVRGRKRQRDEFSEQDQLRLDLPKILPGRRRAADCDSLLKLGLRGLGRQGDDSDGCSDRLPEDDDDVRLHDVGDQRVPGDREVQPEEAAAAQHRAPVEAAEVDEVEVRDLLLGREAPDEPREEPLQVAVQVRQGEELDDLQAGQERTRS